MPLANTQIGAFLKGDLSSALDLGTALFSSNLSRGTAFDNGTGAGQVDKIFTDTRVLNASASEDLDLAGVLTDAFGATITFARVKALLISAASGNTNNVVVGGVAAGLSAGPILPQTTGQVVVRPGGGVAFWVGSADATGYVVTATTADLLHIANSGAGTSVTYDVAIVGCSA